MPNPQTPSSWDAHLAFQCSPTSHPPHTMLLTVLFNRAHWTYSCIPNENLENILGSFDYALPSPSIFQQYLPNLPTLKIVSSRTPQANTTPNDTDGYEHLSFGLPSPPPSLRKHSLAQDTESSRHTRYHGFPPFHQNSNSDTTCHELRF